MNRRVLLLRLDAIGDFVLFTSVLPHLRKLFEDDHLTLVVHSRVAPLAKHCPFVDDVWHVDPERYATDREYVAQVIQHFRGSFDIVINTMYSRTWQSDNIIARTHAPVKIGFECLDNDGKLDRRREDQALYTTLIGTSTEWQFEIERHAQLLNEFGVSVDAQSLRPVHWISDEERQWADEYLSNTLHVQNNITVLCPGAGFDAKRWSGESFARVADWLTEKYQMKVFIAGTSKEKHLAQAIQQASKHPHADITGECSLRQFTALVERAALYVGIDTAGFHVAWTLGIPTVGIFGGGHFGRFIPSLPNVRIVNVPMDCYHCYWHCIYDEIKCITSITPEMVMTEIEHVLKMKHVAGGTQ